MRRSPAKLRLPDFAPRKSLLPHGVVVLPSCPRTFEGIREFLRWREIEGIVFHHPDGRMAKVKKKDYGMRRKLAEPIGTASR